uniref:hypothetical protein n=1 Tax=Arthrobacter sp. 68b TaxID=311808 RepID=UPI0015645811|nr:hypothetical protein [Arthrobacter sp. 68b]
MQDHEKQQHCHKRRDDGGAVEAVPGFVAESHRQPKGQREHRVDAHDNEQPATSRRQQTEFGGTL